MSADAEHTDTRCPRCGADDWRIYGSTTVTAYLTGGPGGGREYDVDSLDSDSFEAMDCRSCGLALQNEPGEQRLRKADAYESSDGAYDGVGLIDDGALRAALLGIAAALLGEG